MNVFAPNSSAKDALPVLFWVHGGGFVAGSGGDVKLGGLFDGSTIATEEKLVVVTINYRLGPLGFLVTSADDGVGGFNGVRDAVLALTWVKQNIAAFGGDATSITVAGESAGGCATYVRFSPRAHS